MHHFWVLSPIITFRFPSLNIICYGQKDPICVRLLKFLSPHAIVESTRSTCIQILNHYLVLWKITSLYFFSSNLMYFLQKSPIKVQIFKLMSFFKRRISFPLTFSIFWSKSQPFLTLNHHSVSWDTSFL